MKRIWGIPIIALLFAAPAWSEVFTLTENEEAQTWEPSAGRSEAGPFEMEGQGENKLLHSDRPPALTAKEKLKYMMRTTYDPKAVIFSMAGVGIKQARDSVPEWGQGTEGYGKRLASSFGHKIVKRNIQFAMGSLLREDPRYFYSQDTGIWRRAFYAASRSFVSNKDEGGIRPGYSKFIATIGGAYISRQWYPERKQTVGEYLTSSGISFGIDMAKNIFNEFWPDIRKLLRR